MRGGGSCLTTACGGQSEPAQILTSRGVHVSSPTQTKPAVSALIHGSVVETANRSPSRYSRRAWGCPGQGHAGQLPSPR